MKTQFKLTDLAAKQDRDNVTTRNYVNQLVEAKYLKVVGEDASGQGRPAKIYANVKRLLVLSAVVLSLAACSNDDGGDGVGSADPDVTTLGYVTCAEWESRNVTADEVTYGCDQGDNHIAGTATYECDDGRTLYWNDAGWGYVGEPMHTHEAGAEQVAPDPERTACPA
jgi:hypothetical protein